MGLGGRLAARHLWFECSVWLGVGHLLLSPAFIQNLAREETLSAVWLLQRFEFPYPPNPPASQQAGESESLQTAAETPRRLGT